MTFLGKKSRRISYPHRPGGIANVRSVFRENPQTKGVKTSVYVVR